MNPYEVLGVSPKAKLKTIQKAYRTLAFKWHPDRDPGDDEASKRFQAVQLAWDVLGDPERRAHYDRTGETNLRVDHTLQKVMGVLSQAMAEALNHLLEIGNRPKDEDMVALIHESIAGRRENLQKQLLDLQKGKTALVEIVDRFQILETEPKDGQALDENPLRSIARAHLTTTEQRMKGLEDEVASLKQAADLLKRYRFKHEKRLIKNIMAQSWISTSTASGW